jgi:hypothetical protein
MQSRCYRDFFLSGTGRLPHDRSLPDRYDTDNSGKEEIDNAESTQMDWNYSR